MSIRLRVGQTLQLPTRNVILVLSLGEGEAVCVFIQPSRQRGEIVFSARWLERFAVVLLS
jgi:hypothetical protein